VKGLLLPHVKSHHWLYLSTWEWICGICLCWVCQQHCAMVWADIWSHCLTNNERYLDEWKCYGLRNKVFEMYQSSGRLLWVIFVLLLSELGKLLLLCTLMQRICWNLMICLQSFVCGNIAICMVQVSTATSAMELVSFLCYCESYVIENVFI